MIFKQNPSLASDSQSVRGMQSYLFEPLAVQLSKNSKDNANKLIQHSIFKERQQQNGSTERSPIGVQTSISVIEEDVQGIPRSVYVTSSPNYRNLGKVRDKIRLSKIIHEDYDSFVNSKEGKRYFKTIMNSKPLKTKGEYIQLDNGVYASDTH